MKNFELTWFLEPLEGDPSYFTKRMFGGLAVYYKDLMILVLVESPGDRQWKDRVFSYDIWNGVLLCTDRIHHGSLIETYPSLMTHPVLGKWLYLPMHHRSFEIEFHRIIDEIQMGNYRVGIIPGSKKKKKKKPKRKVKKKVKKKRKSWLW